MMINYRDARPIYEQLKEQLRKLILCGGIAAGEKLPSVRTLAAELAINPNTIVRAYRELELEGFVYTVQGKGSFAAALSEVNSERQEKLLSQFRALSTELLQLGTDAKTLINIIETEAKSHD